MAVYYCEVCDRLIDGDYNPMVEDPRGDGYCCDECSIELVAEKE